MVNVSNDYEYYWTHLALQESDRAFDKKRISHFTHLFLDHVILEDVNYCTVFMVEPKEIISQEGRLNAVF